MTLKRDPLATLYKVQPRSKPSAGPASDPQAHRAAHEHTWRVLGSIKQCLLCQATEATDV